MQLKRLQNTFSWVVVFSEVSHVFCCVLPTVFSLLTFLVGLGLIGVVPVWMDSMHHIMHDWEFTLIASSGFVLVLGWGLQFLSRRVDCHDTGCGHGPCTPKKHRAGRILTFATILFVINVAIYFGVNA
ncbi:MAG: hypothetical protein GC137_09920 [Alphaproteobacteria bacterium]|nr:hypothetical protein [Alphaproteobacteria bacterium]